MARLVATWMNEDRTEGAQLDADGFLHILHRKDSSEVWSPAERLDPKDFRVTRSGKGHVNMVGVTFIKSKQR